MTPQQPAQPANETAVALASERIRKYSRKAKASNTVRAYRSDWDDFEQFCDDEQRQSLPATPETIALYISALADEGMKASTISRRLAAISKAHAAAGFPSPTSMRNAVVAEVWQGIKRTIGTAQTQKAAATVDYIKTMLAYVPDSLAGKRDRALLLVGFAAALRRSELVALAVDDVQFVPEGITVTVRSSKTDQERAGETIGVALGSSSDTCPVKALKMWMRVGKIESGPIFRSIDQWGNVRSRMTDQSVALIVKRYAALAGLDPDVFSGHSLRAGLATSAAEAGATERLIMKQTRHKSEAMARRYIRSANLFQQNVSGIVGL
jgi:site-specific recombinase XerD